MKAVAIAARRSLLGVPNTVVVRAGVAFGYALVVLAGVGLGLWLLISLIHLRPTAISGMM
ncbi:MAG: hypothetical protein WC815_05830 [Vicinamibacterales bacterium]|jgi:hypothetical protein